MPLPHRSITLTQPLSPCGRRTDARGSCCLLIPLLKQDRYMLVSPSWGTGFASFFVQETSAEWDPMTYGQQIIASASVLNSHFQQVAEAVAMQLAELLEPGQGAGRWFDSGSEYGYQHSAKGPAADQYAGRSRACPGGTQLCGSCGCLWRAYAARPDTRHLPG